MAWSARSLWWSGCLLVAAVLTVALLPVSAEASSAGDFVSRINGARTSHGAGALVVRGDLTAAAQAQAERMARQSKLFHNPNLAGSVSHWSMLAENVGYGPDAATIHQAFMNSASHRTNILNRAYTEVGVGVVFRDHVMWVAEVFRKPTGAKPSASSGRPSASHAATSSRPSTPTANTPTPARPAHAARRAPHRVAHAMAPPRPAARAVALASAAEASVIRVRVPPAAWVPPADQPLNEDLLPTAAFASLGVLGLVLAGAATRIRLF